MRLVSPPRGCYVFNCKVFSDNRGDSFRLESGNFETGSSHQVLITENKDKTLRGLHIADYSKKVYCIQGRIWDVVVDLRESSETYLDYFAVELSGEMCLNVAAGIGHGYISLGESKVVYCLEASYDHAKHDKTLHYLSPEIDIDWPIKTGLVISEKDENLENTLSKFRSSSEKEKILLFGHSGFIGKYVYKELLLDENFEVIKGVSRCENSYDLALELSRVKPKYVFSCLGRTGIPAAKWCEENPIEAFEGNVLALYNLGKLCNKKGIRLIALGTCFVFGGSSDRFFKDDDQHCPSNNLYCHLKSVIEKVVIDYDNVLYLRVNYPISPDDDPRGLIGKVKGYSKVNDTQFSATEISTLFSYLPRLIRSDATGPVNFVNSGTISVADVAKICNPSAEVIHSSSAKLEMSVEKFKEIVKEEIPMFKIEFH